MAEELILSDEGVAGLLVDWRCDPAEFRKRVESMTHRIERAAERLGDDQPWELVLRVNPVEDGEC